MPDKNSVNTRVALIVHSCDRYAFLYKGFEIFFSKYWDFDIDCNYYFATEEKNISINGFKNIHSGKGEWSDRLAFLLKEKINEKYVLYFQEDMWLSKKVNRVFFNNLFKLTEKKNWQLVKLHSSEIYKTISTDCFIEGFNISKFDNRSGYLMSHQVTLWNKDFLLNQLHKNEHPWRNERKASRRLKKLNPDIFHIDYFADNGNKEINQNKDPVLRSEYYTVSFNGMLNGFIQYFIKELMKGSIAHREYALKLEYNYNNNFTHDGLQKPRKTGIFKKIKSWLIE